MKLKTIAILISILLVLPVVYGAGVHITPTNPTTDDDLTCYSDDHPEGEMTYQWSRNGNLLSEENTLSHTDTSVSDTIQCDGYWLGFPDSSDTVSIGESTGTTTPTNGAPVVSEIPDQKLYLPAFFNLDDEVTINLNDYVTDDETTDENIVWEVAPTSLILTLGLNRLNTDLVIDQNNIATITANGLGNDLYSFRAVDEDGLKSNWVHVKVKVIKTITTTKPINPENPNTSNNAPEVTFSSEFEICEDTVITFNLDDYVTDDNTADVDLVWDISETISSQLSDNIDYQYDPNTRTLTIYGKDAGKGRLNLLVTDEQGETTKAKIKIKVTTDCSTGLNDNDNDGFDETVDCDDFNPNINPGATEVLDGVDNDCDGLIDEGFPGGETGLDAPNGDNIYAWKNTPNIDFRVGSIRPIDGQDYYNPGEEVQVLLKLNNRGTGDEKLSLTLLVDSGLLQREKSINVNERSVKWTSVSFVIPEETEAGWHVLRVIAINEQGASTSEYWPFLVI